MGLARDATARRGTGRVVPTLRFYSTHVTFQLSSYKSRAYMTRGSSYESLQLQPTLPITSIFSSSISRDASGRAQDALVSQIDHAACVKQHAHCFFTLYCEYNFLTGRILLPRWCLLCSHSTMNPQKPRALCIAVSSSNGRVSSTKRMRLAYGVKQRHDIAKQPANRKIKVAEMKKLTQRLLLSKRKNLVILFPCTLQS